MIVFGWLCLLAITAVFSVATAVALLWENACPGAVGRGIMIPVLIDIGLIYATWANSPFTVTLTS